MKSSERKWLYTPVQSFVQKRDDLAILNGLCQLATYVCSEHNDGVVRTFKYTLLCQNFHAINFEKEPRW